MTLQAQQSVLCPDISAGAAEFPIPAIIDDPEGLSMSGAAAPQIFGSQFKYADNPGALPATPAAREFLDQAFPVWDHASIWAGCHRTELFGVSANPHPRLVLKSRALHACSGSVCPHD